MKILKTSVLINCFNYEKYVAEAIRSVLGQTQPVDEILIVDDGSSDNSLVRIREAVAGVKNARIVSKSNEGQLSAFNAGFEHATGDILLFLDADDAYESGHVAGVCRVYAERDDVDMVWTGFRKFGVETAEHRPYKQSMCFGNTAALVCLTRKYIGAATSTISIRREAMGRFFPVDRRFYADWRTRADDWLVHGASLAGCRKYYLDVTTVAYRIHGSNLFAGREISAKGKLHYNKIRAEMFEYVRKLVNLPEDVASLLPGEFGMHKNPSFRFFRLYMKTVWKGRRQLGPVKMAQAWWGITRAYWRGNA